VGNIFQEWAPIERLDDQFSPSKYVPTSGTIQGRSSNGNESEEMNFIYKRVPGQLYNLEHAMDEMRILSQPFTGGIVDGQAVGVVPLSEIGTYTCMEEYPSGRVYILDSGATTSNYVSYAPCLALPEPNIAMFT